MENLSEREGRGHGVGGDGGDLVFVGIGGVVLVGRGEGDLIGAWGFIA